MKKFLLSLVALVCATVSFAQNQNELVATVQRGDALALYYGSGAFASAVRWAQENDIIVLSEGKFDGCLIEKNITVRGAGTDKTIITGALRLPFSYKAKMECLTIERLGEGESGQLGTLALNKVCVNIMSSFPFASTDRSASAWFENCIVKKFEMPMFWWSPVDATCYFVNCKLANLVKTCNMVMNNCIINQTKVEDLSKSRIINSIIWNNGNDVVEGKLPASTFVANTLAAGSYKEIFDDVAPEQNCQMVGMDVFEESNPDNDLTDEAKSTYLGTDGTPVGVFGGQLPFNMTNPYPYISKMNVGAVTTADGKLSVEVEVSTVE